MTTINLLPEDLRSKKKFKEHVPHREQPLKFTHVEKQHKEEALRKFEGMPPRIRPMSPLTKTDKADTVLSYIPKKVEDRSHEAKKEQKAQTVGFAPSTAEEISKKIELPPPVEHKTKALSKKLPEILSPPSKPSPKQHGFFKALAMWFAKFDSRKIRKPAHTPSIVYPHSAKVEENRATLPKTKGSKKKEERVTFTTGVSRGMAAGTHTVDTSHATLPSSPPPPPPHPQPPSPTKPPVLAKPTVREEKPHKEKNTEKNTLKRLAGFVKNLNLDTIRQGLMRLFGTKPKQGFEVELLTEEVTGLPSSAPYLIKLGILAGIVLFVAGGIWGYYRYQTIQLSISTTEDQRRLDFILRTIESLKEKQEEFREAQVFIDAIYILLTYRMNWDLFFDKIESLTLENVYYTAIDVEGPTNVRLQVRAATVEDALTQAQIFRGASNFIESVSLSNFDLNEEEVTKVVSGSEGEGQDTETFTASFVEFPLEIKLKDGWFLRKGIL